MPEYLIHVGPHKTGTTYLQLRFDEARARLLNAGVLYPAVWSSAADEPSHRKLVVGLRDNRVGPLTAQFAAIESQAHDYVLISAEGINLLPEPSLRLLKTLTNGHPVTILFYCRRWSDLLPSLWQERVKHGHHETFPGYLASNLSDPFNSPVMNFAHRLALYADVFGRENLLLISYSNLSDEGIDLAEHLGETLPELRRPLSEGFQGLGDCWPNRSLPPLDIEVIRCLNAHDRRSGQAPSPALREWYVGNAARFDLATMFAAIAADQAAMPVSDASPAAQNLHDMLSATYADLMVAPSQPGWMFAPRQANVVYYRQRYLEDRSAWQTLQQLYAAFRDACPQVTGPSEPVQGLSASARLVAS